MNDLLGDWDQHKLLVTKGLDQVQKDVRALRDVLNQDTLRISTEIATLRATTSHQARLWGLLAGAVPPLLILLISKLLN